MHSRTLSIGRERHISLALLRRLALDHLRNRLSRSICRSHELQRLANLADSRCAPNASAQQRAATARGTTDLKLVRFIRDSRNEVRDLARFHHADWNGHSAGAQPRHGVARSAQASPRAMRFDFEQKA
jgi:hypothetical protein